MAMRIDDFLVKELESDLRSNDLNTRRHALISLSRLPRNQRAFELFKLVMSDDDSPEMQYLARRFYNDWRSDFEVETDETPDIFSTGNFDEQAAHASFVTKGRQVKLEVAKQIIEKRDKRTLPLIVASLEKERDAFVIASLVKAVGAVGSTSEITLLQQYLKHEDSRVRANTIEALEMIGDDLIWPLLVPMLQDPDNRVKGNTIKALLKYDEDGARDLVYKLARSSKEGRRDSACHCIKVAARPWAEDILIGMIFAETSDELLKKECDLLADFGSEACVGFLSNELLSSPRERGLCIRYALDSVKIRCKLDDKAVDKLREKFKGGELENRLMKAGGSQDAIKTDRKSAQAAQTYEVSRWDMQEIKNMLPRLRNKIGDPSVRPPARGGRERRAKRGGRDTDRKAVSRSSGVYERLAYLAPFVLGCLLIGFALVAVFSQPEERPVQIPKRQLKVYTGRVRFADQGACTLTIAKGKDYYLARLPKGTDVSNVKAGETVRVKGRSTGAKHFDALVLECVSFELVKRPKKSAVSPTKNTLSRSTPGPTRKPAKQSTRRVNKKPARRWGRRSGGG